MGITVLIFAASCILLPGAVQAQVTAAKVYTKHDGFYRVAVSNLADIFSISESEATATSYFVENMGNEVASVRDAGDVVFYAHRYRGPYTDENVFWIKPGDPSVLPTLSVGQGYTPYKTSCQVIKRFEQHNTIRLDLVADLIEDPILWRMLTSGLITKSYTAIIDVDEPVSGSAGFLSVRMKGATDLPGQFYHRVRIDLNGNTLGYMDFDGTETKEVSFPVGAGQWLAGNNSVYVLSSPPPGTYFDSSYLDNIHADYDRNLVALNDQITLPVDAVSVEVRGFSADSITLWDVTDQWGIRQVTGQAVVQDGGQWKLRFDTTETIDVAAVVPGAELQPLRVVPSNDIGLKNQDWEVDHLVVSCPLLLDSAADITTHRSLQGLDAEIISVDDIYDSFNYGIRDVRAIERFLTYAYRNWAKHPRYVVLVGDGSADNYNLMGFNDSRIPASALMGTRGKFSTDYRLGNIGVTGQLHMAVGRIPVNDEQELDEYISKMINYESGGDWRTNKLVSTDQNDYGGNFLSIGNDLTVFIEGNVHRGDLTTQNITEVRDAVIHGINQGREMSMYVGHGTPNQLSSQEILELGDMGSLTNDSSPTAFVAIGCLIGSFHDPGKVNLGEALVFAKGGASALVGAATLIAAGDGVVLSESILTNLYEMNVDRIGDAWITGKNELTAAFRIPAFTAFQLLGDPGMAVGAAQSARVGSGAPSMPDYDEWAETITPPSLEDMGFTLLPNADDDGDESDNFTEFQAGTDPFNPWSVLEIVRIKRPAPGYVEVSWPSNAGRSYTIESAFNVLGPYTELVTSIAATPPENTESFPADTSVPHCYRVVVE